jgi:hypothetical protein
MMFNQEEHDKVVALIKAKGVPPHSPRTLFGNVRSDVVMDIVEEALNIYRESYLEKRRQKRKKK